MKFTINPLKTCKLRVMPNGSTKGAKFGMTRTHKNGKPKPHQGVDLAVDNNYRCYAVEDCEVVEIRDSISYGLTITLKLDCPDKPELNGKFAFYAHLNREDVSLGQKLKAGDIVGLTGDTGNADGMTTIANGGHLHFELRTQKICSLGLVGRIDPLPYIDLI